MSSDGEAWGDNGGDGEEEEQEQSDEEEYFYEDDDDEEGQDEANNDALNNPMTLVNTTTSPSSSWMEQRNLRKRLLAKAEEMRAVHKQESDIGAQRGLDFDITQRALDEAKQGQIFSTEASVGVLVNEFLSVREEVRSTLGVDIEAVGDNVFHWKLVWHQFVKGTALHRSMNECERRHGFRFVEFHIHFAHDLYPFYPPSVHLVRPRFEGPVQGAIAGLSCLQLSHYSPVQGARTAIDAVCVVLSRSNLDLDSAMNDPTMHPEGAYSGLEVLLMRLSTVSEIPRLADTDESNIGSSMNHLKTNSESSTSSPSVTNKRKPSSDSVCSLETLQVSSGGASASNAIDLSASSSVTSAAVAEVTTHVDLTVDALAATSGVDTPTKKAKTGTFTAAMEAAANSVLAKAYDIFPDVESATSSQETDNKSGGFAKGTGYSAQSQAGWDVEAFMRAHEEQDKQLARVLLRIAAELDVNGMDQQAQMQLLASAKEEIGSSALLPVLVANIEQATLLELELHNTVFNSALTVCARLAGVPPLVSLFTREFTTRAVTCPKSLFGALQNVQRLVQAYYKFSGTPMPSGNGSAKIGGSTRRAGSVGSEFSIVTNSGQGGSGSKATAASGAGSSSSSLAAVASAGAVDEQRTVVKNKNKKKVGGEKGEDDDDEEQEEEAQVDTLERVLSVFAICQSVVAVNAPAVVTASSDSAGAIRQDANGKSGAETVGDNPLEDSDADRIDAEYTRVLAHRTFDHLDSLPDPAVASLRGAGPSGRAAASAAGAPQLNSRARFMRVGKELVDLSRSLPFNTDSSVFVRASAERLDHLQFLITGPCDSPYAYGCFVFDMVFPELYPRVPPKVQILTTGGGSVRFNPNLYNCGKVCLSLLGTWRGAAGESWNEKTSTVLQVLISIQSLILVNEPYFNEPGYQSSMGTESGQARSREYNKEVRRNCIAHAMVGVLSKLPMGFEDVVQDHFRTLWPRIRRTVSQWVSEDETLKIHVEKMETLVAGLTTSSSSDGATSSR